MFPPTGYCFKKLLTTLINYYLKGHSDLKCHSYKKLGWKKSFVIITLKKKNTSK